LEIFPFSINSANWQQPIQHFKEQTKNPLQFAGDGVQFWKVKDLRGFRNLKGW
jgi:hypothetical protein